MPCSYLGFAVYTQGCSSRICALYVLLVATLQIWSVKQYCPTAGVRSARCTNYAISDDALSLQMAQYGSGPQRGPMGQTLMGGLNNVGQRGIPGNAGLGQAALQRQAGNGVNMGALGGASGKRPCMGSQTTLYALLHPDVF